MKVNITSADNLFFILNNLKNNESNNIEIANLDSSVIPYLYLLIDRCKKLNGSVQIKKQLLIKLDILEHLAAYFAGVSTFGLEVNVLTAHGDI